MRGKEQSLPRLISRIVTSFMLAVTLIIAFASSFVYAEPLPRADSISLPGKFLVAEDNIRDPRFTHSVLLITHHDSNGTLALMINHPTEILLSRALPGVAELTRRQDKLFIGGPMTGVPFMMLVSSAANLASNSTRLVFDDVYVSINRQLIPWILDQKGVKFRAYSGYASWAPGQLESELERRIWHLENADAFTIFQKDSSRIWPDLSNFRDSPRWVNVMHNFVKRASAPDSPHTHEDAS